MVLSTSAQGEVRAYAKERIAQMAARPLMWAATQEGFFSQLWLLLEMSGVPTDEIRLTAVRLFGNGMSNAGETLTKEEAVRQVDAMLKLFEG